MKKKRNKRDKLAVLNFTPDLNSTLLRNKTPKIHQEGNGLDYKQKSMARFKNRK